jgi:hypothetical protein
MKKDTLFVFAILAFTLFAIFLVVGVFGCVQARYGASCPSSQSCGTPENIDITVFIDCEREQTECNIWGCSSSSCLHLLYNCEVGQSFIQGCKSQSRSDGFLCASQYGSILLVISFFFAGVFLAFAIPFVM